MKPIFIILCLFSRISFGQSGEVRNSTTTIQQQVWALTETMYHDVVNPPAAARFYAYSLLTGYEILSALDSSAPKFQLNLKDYPHGDYANNISAHKELAVLYGILEAGRMIIPSGYLLEEKQRELVNKFRNMGLEERIIDSSLGLARKITRMILQYSKSDGYFRLSTLARFKPSTGDSCWRPTPPEYMAAIEPHWQIIRTFFIDSAQQFRPDGPVSYSTNTSSAFMELANEVYSKGKQLSAEEVLVANFWDCNPFAVQYQGHMSIGLKKISPGGHWMGIAGISAEKAGLNFTSSLLLHTLTALTLHDAFTSCWYEKYRTNRIRPETFINRYIDPKWKPLLQTPPFPEYSSGHSVISTAVAEVLTHFLGDGFAFEDSIETYLGMPSREFPSFRAAAEEARISRLYGGIHFRDAIENGGVQGRRIGEFIIRKLGNQVLVMY